MAGVDVQGVDGLKDFARDLRRVDRDLAKQLSRGHKDIASAVATASKQKGRVTFGRQASQVSGISGRGSATKASIALNTGRTKRLLAAEFGTRVHTVFGRRVRAASMRRPVFRPWSGNQFVAGDGPADGVGYAVHPTVRQRVRSGWVSEQYGDRVMDSLAVAFPER